ncbi:MAG: hypothetical protein NTY19_05395 [Planctomycetota bacterium]|nr:hypothetical protein [Planctomycetota bacterium]
MDGTAAVQPKKFSENSAEETRTEQLKKRLESLFREAAEVEVELSRADGTIRGVPHYSLIEERAHQLGQRLSREVQQRQMGEVLASQSLTAKCPTCGIRCEDVSGPANPGRVRAYICRVRVGARRRTRA